MEYEVMFEVAGLHAGEHGWVVDAESVEDAESKLNDYCSFHDLTLVGTPSIAARA